jgi:hypothetical protein
MPNTIERDIHFYRVDTGYDQSGKPKSFDPIPVLEHVGKLAWKDGQGRNRYWDNDGKVTGCWVHNSKMPCKVTLGTIRRTDLPLMENQGELSPLEIPDKAGLVEQTHIVFLGDDIVGCDINYYGPRVSRLAFYLADKAVGIAPEILNFNPILRRDVLQQLKKMTYLKSIELKIRSSYADDIADIDKNLYEALAAARRAAGGEDIDIGLIFQASSRSHGWLYSGLLETIKAICTRPEVQYEMRKLVVNGYNAEKQKALKLDLLSDKLIIKRSILKIDSKSNALNPKSAFDAIISAYEEIKDEILIAPSAVI